MTSDELKALRSILTDRRPEALPAVLSLPEVTDLYEFLLALRGSILAISQGDLSQTIERKGYLAGSLKTMQANFQHLSWQTQMISQGDFSQRIDFMGEFSTAFNSMTQQLKEAREQLRAVNQLLQHRADTDGLTDLFNHAFIINTLETEIERSRRHGATLSIVMLDIDHFKKFNDTYGHQVGDSVLIKTAELLRSPLRASDSAGRYGGEEFMLVLPNTDHDGACVLAEKVRSIIETTPFTEAKLQVTISAGIATWNQQTSANLIQVADEKLYEAKRNGRNRIWG